MDAIRSPACLLPTPLVELRASGWQPCLTPAERAAATNALEWGAVLFLPQLAFVLEPHERQYLSPHWSVGSSKNISFDPCEEKIHGARGSSSERSGLGGLISRFSLCARDLAAALFPTYGASLAVGRATFRPVQAENRVTSWRKDDRLLHVDAFPSRPSRGARILRVFSNVNPHRARLWRLGEPFESLAGRFAPGLPQPNAAAAQLLAALRLTRGARSAYDQLMLRLHDRMKADRAYQMDAPQLRFAFPPGSTWIFFSDQVSHAVLRGQYALEQTFQLPVAAMREPARAPLHVLERLLGRALA
jgi:hypothetical protein